MLFADNVCEINMHRCIYIMMMISCQPTPLLLALLYLPLLHEPTLLSYLLGDSASFAHGVNTHPLLSLVCYQLSSPCCFTHPKTPHRSSYIFTQMTSTTSAVPSDTSITKSLYYIQYIYYICTLYLKTWSEENKLLSIYIFILERKGHVVFIEWHPVETVSR